MLFSNLFLSTSAIYAVETTRVLGSLFISSKVYSCSKYMLDKLVSFFRILFAHSSRVSFFGFTNPPGKHHLPLNGKSSLLTSKILIIFVLVFL